MAPLLIDGGSLSKRFIIAAAAIVAIASTSIADAKPRHAHKRLTQAQVTCDQRGCSDNPAAQGGQARASRANADAMPTQTADANGNVVGGRPSGCPHRFCGCSASLYVFGEIRPELNLAAN